MNPIKIQDNKGKFEKFEFFSTMNRNAGTGEAIVNLAEHILILDQGAINSFEDI